MYNCCSSGEICICSDKECAKSHTICAISHIILNKKEPNKVTSYDVNNYRGRFDQQQCFALRPLLQGQGSFRLTPFHRGASRVCRWDMMASGVCPRLARAFTRFTAGCTYEKKRLRPSCPTCIRGSHPCGKASAGTIPAPAEADARQNTVVGISVKKCSFMRIHFLSVSKLSNSSKPLFL